MLHRVHLTRGVAFTLEVESGVKIVYSVVAQCNSLACRAPLLSMQGHSLFTPGPEALAALAALASGRKRPLRLPAVRKRHSTPLAVKYLHVATA